MNPAFHTYINDRRKLALNVHLVTINYCNTISMNLTTGTLRMPTRFIIKPSTQSGSNLFCRALQSTYRCNLLLGRVQFIALFFSMRYLKLVIRTKTEIARYMLFYSLMLRFGLLNCKTGPACKLLYSFFLYCFCWQKQYCTFWGYRSISLVLFYWIH